MSEELRLEIYKEIIAERDKAWDYAKKMPDFEAWKEHNLIGWMAMSNAAYIAGGGKKEHKISELPE